MDPDSSSQSEMTDRRELNAEELLKEVREAQRAVEDEGRQEAIEAQHEAGKLSARERIEYLCDDGEFREIGQLAAPSPTTPEMYDWSREDAPADGVATGIGEIDSRPVAIGATDFTVKGGSMGHAGGEKLARIARLALKRGFPVVFLHDGGGHRIQEGLDARAYAGTDGEMFKIQQQLSGWVPIVSAMMGPGFAAPTNYAALSDFVPMVEGTSTLGVAGPSLVKAALGVDLSKEELGGAQFQTAETGMADIACESDEACLDAIKTFLSYLPRNARQEPPRRSDSEPPYDEQVEKLIDRIPADPKKGYDIYEIIDGIVDMDSFFELKPTYARNLVTGFARIEGRPIGVVANNPTVMAGTIDAPASDKGSRFISLCDAFGLPFVWLIDTPGVLPGPDSERQGVARRSGKLIFESSRATVPTVSVVLRRGYGLGYVVMGGGRSGDSELSVIWPTAEIAAMSIEGAVDIAYRRDYENADDPESRRAELIEKFTDRTGPVRAAEGMGVDAVIDPRETREHIAQTFDRMDEQHSEEWPPKKHSINPL